MKIIAGAIFVLAAAVMFGSATIAFAVRQEVKDDMLTMLVGVAFLVIGFCLLLAETRAFLRTPDQWSKPNPPSDTPMLC